METEEILSDLWWMKLSVRCWLNLWGHEKNQSTKQVLRESREYGHNIRSFEWEGNTYVTHLGIACCLLEFKLSIKRHRRCLCCSICWSPEGTENWLLFSQDWARNAFWDFPFSLGANSGRKSVRMHINCENMLECLHISVKQSVF